MFSAVSACSSLPFLSHSFIHSLETRSHHVAVTGLNSQSSSRPASLRRRFCAPWWTAPATRLKSGGCRSCAVNRGPPITTSSSATPAPACWTSSSPSRPATLRSACCSVSRPCPGASEGGWPFVSRCGHIWKGVTGYSDIWAPSWKSQFLPLSHLLIFFHFSHN